MDSYQEIKSALENLVVREKILKAELKEIQDLKIKIAFMLGGGELDDEEPKRS